MTISDAARPRLGEHVLSRGHWVDGVFSVVLHETRSGELLTFGMREWLLLAAADGTRDLDGIRLAASREGSRAEAASVRAFFERLHAMGLLDEGDDPGRARGRDDSITPALAAVSPGLPPPDPTDLAAAAPRAPLPMGATPPNPRDTAPRAPIEQLPGYAFYCDGRGACCKSYSTVTFSSLEAARARALRPGVLAGGERLDNVFYPQKGLELRAGLAVVQVDGRCAYLERDGRCGIHAAGGEASKPLGCRTFPAGFVDDGEVVRVSPALECACVLESALASGAPRAGGPLLAHSVARRGDLDPSLHVEVLPAEPLAAEGRTGTLASLRAWSRVVARAAPPPRDAARTAWALAAALGASGFDPEAATAAMDRPPPIDPAELAPWVAALAVRATQRAMGDASWRSTRDLTRMASALVATASARVLDGGLAATLEAPADPAREAFALRAYAFGHAFALSPPCDRAVRDFAVRLVVARALGAHLAATPHDEALREPIAVVFALLRGHGVGKYVNDLA